MPMFDSNLVTKATTSNCPRRMSRPQLWSTRDRRRTRCLACVRLSAVVVRRLLSFAPSSAPDVATTRERSLFPIERAVNDIHFHVAPEVLGERVVAFFTFAQRINLGLRRILLPANLPP